MILLIAIADFVIGAFIPPRDVQILQGKYGFYNSKYSRPRGVKDETLPSVYVRDVYTRVEFYTHIKLNKRDGRVITRVRNSKFSQKETQFVTAYVCE